MHRNEELNLQCETITKYRHGVPGKARPPRSTSGSPAASGARGTEPSIPPPPMRRETESEHAKHWPASFRPIMTLAEKLRTGEPFNCNTVAAELDVDPKTIMRAINQLRAHGWVINYDERAHEYWLRKAPRPRLF